jgi:carbon monoxide dehydrogenase subunit G
MKIEGHYTVSATREVVWQQLLNPEALARAIHGCQKLEPNPDGSYHAELSVGIAAVKGKYRGRIEILDPVPLEHYRMKVDGQGTGGFLKGEGTIRLADAGAETLINYSGDAQVGGVIASVGQRLIQAAAKQIVAHFFETFAKQIASSQPPSAAGPASAAADVIPQL